MIVQESQLMLPDEPHDKLMAVADVLVVGKLSIHGIKLIHADGRMFLSMPSTPIKKRCPCGGHNVFAAKFCNWCGRQQDKFLLEGKQRLYSEIVHPIDRESRAALTTAIIDKFNTEATNDTVREVREDRGSYQE